jgi:hypothetical protein
MSMAKPIDHPRQTLLIGFGAIIVTLLMASGEWSILDFGTSVAIVALGLRVLKANELMPTSKTGIPFGALVFCIVTTAALIS